ncbi:MAG: hypothetical protein ACYDHZ_03290 [Dehalococcoidia bacterium]
MPPQTTFSKEIFIEAAFKVVRTRGIENLSARSLTRELHCSTMPIYSYLKSMKKLRSDLRKKAADLLMEYQNRVYTGEIFYDMGMGYILFARNEKNLFRFLFTENGPSARHSRTGGAVHRTAFENLIVRMKDDPTLTGLDEKRLENILIKMWIFSHGIAFLVNYDELPSNKEEYIKELMYEAGRAIITDEFNIQINKKES